MKLKHLVADHGVQIDEEDLKIWGEHYAYRDDQFRIVVCRGERKSEEFLHRLLIPGFPSVDHKDGNPGNNKRDNLRGATLSQNQGNRKLNINNTSGYKGVKKVGKRWQARLHRDGAEKHLGMYSTAELAALAYNEEAIKYFGEFAKLNQIQNGQT